MARYLTTAIIRGRGRFPIDMLRYDRCCPCSATDASIIETSLEPGGIRDAETGGRAEWEVKVRKECPSKSACYYAWTIERWRSFCCTVTEDAPERIA